MSAQFVTRVRSAGDGGAIPDRMLDSIARHIDGGIPCGSFLTAVLSNDLYEACRRADCDNRGLLFEYVQVLHNHAPANAWGSEKAVADWQAAKSVERSAA